MISTKDVSKFDYLRDRPFLVVDFLIRPTDRTERKGWKEHHTFEEYPRILQRISHKTLCRAHVIIDLANDRVIKNRLRDTGDLFDDEALNHYKRKYAEQVGSALLSHRP